MLFRSNTISKNNGVALNKKATNLTPSIVSFGDSFIFGMELQDNDSGDKSWVGQAASRLGADYETFARPGCGNEDIARQVYTYFSHPPNRPTLAVINWTWTSRWDVYRLGTVERGCFNRKDIAKSYYEGIAGSDWPSYHNFVNGTYHAPDAVSRELEHLVQTYRITDAGTWFTVGPTCQPERLAWMNDDHQSAQVLDFYAGFVHDSVLWNNYRSLQAIFSVQCYLKNLNIPSVQTYMDYEMFTTDSLLSPDYVQVLQSQVNLELFDQDLNFLDWARSKNYAVTESPRDHPLEDAHAAACDLWINRYKEKLFN